MQGHRLTGIYIMRSICAGFDSDDYCSDTPLPRFQWARGVTHMIVNQ
jgi:hypothetical protein